MKSTTYGNGLTQTEALNKRLQPCRTNVNSSGTLLNTCTDSTPSGTLLDLTYGWNAGTSDNGNLATFTAAGQQVFNRTYGYTSLNQLSSMSDSDTVASCQGATWSYDPWANRTAQTPTKGSCGMWSSSYTANNQISGYSYDAAGNLLNDGTHGYTYDAENRISAVASTATYVYDADGKRVSKTAGGVESDYIFDPSGNPMTIYGSGCGNSCWARGYIYANGREIAEYGSSTTYFVTTDHLGSTRLMTAMNQSVYDSMDYMPFGEQMAGGTGSTHKFTGKERDSESNLDNFGARYNSSTLGRFMSPDPSGIALANPTDPQELNLYSYVRNNPLTLIDPTGLCGVEGDEGSPCGGAGDGFRGGKTCSIDGGGPAPCELAGGPDAGAPCPNNNCKGLVYEGNSFYKWQYSRYLQFVCDGNSTDCDLKNDWLEWVADADPSIWRYGRVLGDQYIGDIAHQLATAVSARASTQTIFELYAIGASGGLSAGLEPMDIAVGPGDGGPFHMAYGVDGTWLNSYGHAGYQFVGRPWAQQTADSAWFTLRAPVLNSARVLATEGCSASSCVGATLSALAKGWIPW